MSSVEDGGLQDDMEEMSDNEILAFSSQLEGAKEPEEDKKPKVEKKIKKEAPKNRKLDALPQMDEYSAMLAFS